MSDRGAAYWRERHAALVAADGDEWDRLSEAYDADWDAAYCAAFRAEARARGWSEENIESGWLDNLPEEARLNFRPDRTPEECARADVKECEWEAANA